MVAPAPVSSTSPASRMLIDSTTGSTSTAPTPIAASRSNSPSTRNPRLDATDQGPGRPSSAASAATRRPARSIRHDAGSIFRCQSISPGLVPFEPILLARRIGRSFEEDERPPAGRATRPFPEDPGTIDRPVAYYEKNSRGIQTGSDPASSRRERMSRGMPVVRPPSAISGGEGDLRNWHSTWPGGSGLRPPGRTRPRPACRPR